MKKHFPILNLLLKYFEEKEICMAGKTLLNNVYSNSSSGDDGSGQGSQD